MFAALLLTCVAPVPGDAARLAALVRQLETGTPGERVIAAESLGDLGPAAASAAPALARVALNTRYSETLGLTLRITNRADEFLFDACLAALARIGPKAADDLAKLLDHEEEFARGQALAHFHHGPDPPLSAVPILIRRLRDGSYDDVSIAAELLGRLGPAATSAVPALVDLFLGVPYTGGRPPLHAFGSPPRVAAVQALVRIGPEGTTAIRTDVLPLVAAEIRAGIWGSDVLPLLGEAGAPALAAVTERLATEPDAHRRAVLAALLPGLGAEGRRAFAVLMDNPKVHSVAIQALGGTPGATPLPPDVVGEFVPHLLAACRTGAVADRVAAVHALAQLGEAAPPDAVEAVAALLDDATFLDALAENGSRNVVNFVYDLSRFPRDRVRLPEAAVRTGNAAVRREAVQAFWRPEVRRSHVLPLLRRVAADDPDPAVAVQAAVVALGISQDPVDLDPVLARGAFRGRDVKPEFAPAHAAWVLNLAARSRHELAPRPEPQSTEPDNIPALVERLRAAAAADFPEEVIDRVAALGPVAAADAVPVLAELVPKLEARSAANVMNAVAVMGPAAQEAVPVVTRRLTDADAAWHVPAALALAEIGPGAKDAVPALRKLLVEPDPDLRLAAAYALARVAGEKDAFRVAFDRVVRREVAFAAEVFDRAAPHAPELLPTAIRWLETGSPGAALVSGLVKYGPAAKAAVPALLRVVGDPRSPTETRRAACAALAAIGPAARGAIPELRSVVENADFETALAARDAILALKGTK